MQRDLRLLPLNMLRREAEARAAAPELLSRLADGRLQLALRTFALSQAAEALAWIAERGHRGRAVLTPDPARRLIASSWSRHARFRALAHRRDRVLVDAARQTAALQHRDRDPHLELAAHRVLDLARQRRARARRRAPPKPRRRPRSARRTAPGRGASSTAAASARSGRRSARRRGRGSPSGRRSCPCRSACRRCGRCSGCAGRCGRRRSPSPPPRHGRASDSARPAWPRDRRRCRRSRRSRPRARAAAWPVSGSISSSITWRGR